MFPALNVTSYTRPTQDERRARSRRENEAFVYRANRKFRRAREPPLDGVAVTRGIRSRNTRPNRKNTHACAHTPTHCFHVSTYLHTLAMTRSIFRNAVCRYIARTVLCVCVRVRRDTISIVTIPTRNARKSRRKITTIRLYLHPHTDTHVRVYMYTHTYIYMCVYVYVIHCTERGMGRTIIYLLFYFIFFFCQSR